MTLTLPVFFKDDRESMNDYVQETADDQTQQTDHPGKGLGIGGEESGQAVHRAALCPKAGVQRYLRPGLNGGRKLEDRQVHGDDQTADDNAQECHDDGFEQAGQSRHGIVHFRFVKISDFAEHLVEFA